MAWVKNRRELLSHGVPELREIALDAIETGLTAIDPLAALQAQARVDENILRIADRQYVLDSYDRVVVLGAGKASIRVAEGIELLLGDRISEGLVVTPMENPTHLRRIRTMTADHPLPTERSLLAAEAALKIASEIGPRDLMIACITGGSSALLCAPPPGVTLEEKRALNQRLLASGAAIREINTVRKQVSCVKGGRLAAASHAAAILNVTVSDVAGDHLDLVTDPTVPNSTSPQDAIDILQDLKLWNRVAPAIRQHLREIATHSVPTLADRDIFSVTVVNGKSARQAMQAVAARHGFQPIWLGTTIEGIGHEVGVVLGDISGTSHREGTPFSRRSLLLACGGEASVNIGDDEALFGLGGPCQELALGAAERLRADDAVALVAIDTDGSDGSSRYAGAVVDGLTEKRARSAGLSLSRAWREHRSSDFLQTLGDGLRTGLTGTNVNDMLAVVIG